MNKKMKLYASLFAFVNASSLFAADDSAGIGVSAEMICLIILIFLSFFILALLFFGANDAKAGKSKRENEKIKNTLDTISNSVNAVLKKIKSESSGARSIDSVIDTSTTSKELYDLKTVIISSKNNFSSELKELKNEISNISLFLEKDNKNKLIDEIKNLQKINTDQEKIINEAQMQIDQLSRQNNDASQNDFLQHIIPGEVTAMFNDIDGFGGPDCDPKLLDLYFALISLHHKAEARDKDELRKGFIMFDGFLFDTFKDNIDSLNALRERFSSLLNDDYLKGYFQIDWPAPGDIFDPSRHKSHMSSGNRIALAESAVICNSEGQVLVPARVETRR